MNNYYFIFKKSGLYMINNIMYVDDNGMIQNI